jgi:hypothetical protein
VIAERNQNITTTLKSFIQKQYSDLNENNVMIVDQSYLMHNFKVVIVQRQAISKTSNLLKGA